MRARKGRVPWERKREKIKDHLHVGIAVGMEVQPLQFWKLRKVACPWLLFSLLLDTHLGRGARVQGPHSHWTGRWGTEHTSTPAHQHEPPPVHRTTAQLFKQPKSAGTQHRRSNKDLEACPDSGIV